MRRMGILATILVVGMLILLPITPAMAKGGGKTITKGEIIYSLTHYLAGQPIPTGFDAYGYNYQGHMFSGSYFNSYAGGAGLPAWEGDDAAYLAENPSAATHWAWPYREVNIIMKWNDAWISNKSYDGDNYLDRHPGFPGYIGSGAWLTNHQSGDNEDGTKWTYFVKIVAAPADATKVGGVWYTVDGTEIGPAIWTEFAIIQQVENDPSLGLHGVQYISPNNAGLGSYAP
ncbi:MAG: hypothetical protein PHN78_07525 [Dehalococcoidales bacterium]|nr:hypothetical protein [Dehalococcoidales bacterium]